MHTFLDPLQRALQVAPNSTAFVCEDVEITYAQFGERCQQLAAFLQSKGAKFGDLVAIWADNSHRSMEA